MSTPDVMGMYMECGTIGIEGGVGRTNQEKSKMMQMLR